MKIAMKAFAGVVFVLGVFYSDSYAAPPEAGGTDKGKFESWAKRAYDELIVAGQVGEPHYKPDENLPDFFLMSNPESLEFLEFKKILNSKIQKAIREGHKVLPDLTLGLLRLEEYLAYKTPPSSFLDLEHDWRALIPVVLDVAETPGQIVAFESARSRAYARQSIPSGDTEFEAKLLSVFAQTIRLREEKKHGKLFFGSSKAAPIKTDEVLLISRLVRHSDGELLRTLSHNQLRSLQSQLRDSYGLKVGHFLPPTKEELLQYPNYFPNQFDLRWFDSKGAGILYKLEFLDWRRANIQAIDAALGKPSQESGISEPLESVLSEFEDQLRHYFMMSGHLTSDDEAELASRMRRLLMAGLFEQTSGPLNLIHLLQFARDKGFELENYKGATMVGEKALEAVAKLRLTPTEWQKAVNQSRIGKELKKAFPRLLAGSNDSSLNARSQFVELVLALDPPRTQREFHALIGMMNNPQVREFARNRGWRMTPSKASRFCSKLLGGLKEIVGL